MSFEGKVRPAHIPKCSAETVPGTQTAERREEVVVCVQIENVLLEQIVAHVEERGERVAGAEELSERGTRVAVELVREI